MMGGDAAARHSTMVLELTSSALIKTSLPGIASAVSVLLFLVSLLLIVPLFAVRRRANEEAVA
jgi:ABC-type sugar transport system permease subunit